jgi:hypothetical protein
MGTLERNSLQSPRRKKGIIPPLNGSKEPPHRDSIPDPFPPRSKERGALSTWAKRTNDEKDESDVNDKDTVVPFGFHPFRRFCPFRPFRRLSF